MRPHRVAQGAREQAHRRLGCIYKAGEGSTQQRYEAADARGLGEARRGAGVARIGGPIFHKTLSGPIDDEPKQTHERNLPQKGGDLYAAVTPELLHLPCRGGEKDEYERAGGGAGVRGYGGGGFSFYAGNSWTARRRRTISLYALFYNRCVNLPRLSPWAWRYAPRVSS